MGKRIPGNPMYSTKTIIYQVFSMAMKGTTLEEIHKFCKKHGSHGAGRLIRILRRGEHRGRKWKLEEANGRIKATEIQPRQKKK